jgi:DNA-binding HxlR family transcriptional regulator
MIMIIKLKRGERQVYPVIPGMVEYSLTPLGRTLVEPLKTLCNWAREHFHEVEAARESNSSKTNG